MRKGKWMSSSNWQKSLGQCQHPEEWHSGRDDTKVSVTKRVCRQWLCLPRERSWPQWPHSAEVQVEIRPAISYSVIPMKPGHLSGPRMIGVPLKSSCQCHFSWVLSSCLARSHLWGLTSYGLWKEIKSCCRAALAQGCFGYSGICFLNFSLKGNGIVPATSGVLGGHNERQ